MPTQFIVFITDESKWLTLSMSLALLSIAILLYRRRRSDFPARRRVLAAMNLFFGVTIGTMAFGHLFAVSTRLAFGTLKGSLLVVYVIGFALAAPSWCVIQHTRKILASDDKYDYGPTTMVLNGWLAITLLALGFHNVPLAAPALFNIGYYLHSRPIVGWTIATTAIVFNAGLFVGSLIFLASGQSFEQFKGIEP